MRWPGQDVVEAIVRDRIASAMQLRCVIQGCIYRSVVVSYGSRCMFCGAPPPETTAPPGGPSHGETEAT